MAGFDAAEKKWLYKKLAGHLLQLVCWPAVFGLVLVLAFVFVFVSQYQLPPKLAASVRSLMSFKS